MPGVPKTIIVDDERAVEVTLATALMVIWRHRRRAWSRATLYGQPTIERSAL